MFNYCVKSAKIRPDANGLISKRAKWDTFPCEAPIKICAFCGMINILSANDWPGSDIK